MYWLDNNDDISNMNFENALFITEHQVDKNMPILDSCYYAVHYSTDSKYDHLKKIHRFIDLKVYKNIFLGSETMQEIEPFVFYDVPNQVLMFPWATDLLPEEIDLCKQNVNFFNDRHLQLHKKIFWVGTIGDGLAGNINELKPFIKASQENHVEFIQIDPWVNPVSFDANRKMIQKSYLAPAIAGKIQIEHDYIPCRVFKNISYGKVVGTNSLSAYKLFRKKIVFNTDTYQLFYDMKEKVSQGNIQELCELMDFVKDYHTYLNRIQHLIKFIDLLQEFNGLSIATEKKSLGT